MALLILVGIGIAAFLRRTKKAGERELAATIYYCDMGDLFRELFDDPFMSSEKWREWLPLFEDADRRFAETHPYVEEFFRYAEAVKREIDDLPFEKIGSSSR